MVATRNLTSIPKGKRGTGTSPIKATARKERANKGKGEDNTGAHPRGLPNKYAFTSKINLAGGCHTKCKMNTS